MSPTCSGPSSSQIRRISAKRIFLPPREPYVEGHNTWIANAPASLLIFPVGDLAQHVLLNIAFYAQNGFAIYDDINRRAIPGIEELRRSRRRREPYLVSFLDQYPLAELSAELAIGPLPASCCCRRSVSADGFHDGIDRPTILGASGDPDAPGLGFRYDTDPRWPQPNPTGLEGVFESFHAAALSGSDRSGGGTGQTQVRSGGPFHPETPGP